MKTIKTISFVVVGCALVFGFVSSCMTASVDQRAYCFVSMFGTVKRTVDTPGLIFVWPFESVSYVSKQLQEYDEDEPEATVTFDKKNILISYFAVYRVAEPLVYVRTVGDEFRAEKTLADVIYSEVKSEVSGHPLEEVITEREKIAAAVKSAAEGKVRQYGIELVDLRIKRTDLAQDVLASVYQRMRAEREKMAQVYRSEGQKKKMTLEASGDRKEKEILAGAYKKRQEIMGEGDAESLRILWEAYSKDVEFAMFLRSLDVYRDTFLTGGKKLILTSDSEFLQYLTPERGAAATEERKN